METAGRGGSPLSRPLPDVPSPCSAELCFEKGRWCPPAFLSVVQLSVSHRWTYDIPNATDGIVYSGLTGSNNRRKTVAFGARGASGPEPSRGEEGTGESEDSGLAGPPRDPWLNPRDVTLISCRRAVKAEQAEWARATAPAPSRTARG